MLESTYAAIDITLLQFDEYQGQHTVFIKSPQPDFIKGCPMGRGFDPNSALKDLCYRVKIESHVVLTIDDY